MNDYDTVATGSQEGRILGNVISNFRARYWLQIDGDRSSRSDERNKQRYNVIREEKVVLVDVLSGKAAEDFNIFPTLNRCDTRL